VHPVRLLVLDEEVPPETPLYRLGRVGEPPAPFEDALRVLVGLLRPQRQSPFHHLAVGCRRKVDYPPLRGLIEDS